jgi:hypothetical protein
MDIDLVTQYTPEDNIMCGAVGAMMASTPTLDAPEGGTVGAMMASTPMQSLRLGCARAVLSLHTKATIAQAVQAVQDYEHSLKVASWEEWDTNAELLEDGARTNPMLRGNMVWPCE